jgi:hypothetical protein
VRLFERRSAIGLVGDAIDVETGAWLSRTSRVGAGVHVDLNARRERREALSELRLPAAEEHLKRCARHDRVGLAFPSRVPA